MERTVSQALFLDVRVFEERYQVSPKYILMNTSCFEELQAEARSILSYGFKKGTIPQFMGIDIIPSDSIKGFYLVKGY